jgi:hypothetical protein
MPALCRTKADSYPSHRPPRILAFRKPPPLGSRSKGLTKSPYLVPRPNILLPSGHSFQVIIEEPPEDPRTRVPRYPRQGSSHPTPPAEQDHRFAAAGHCGAGGGALVRWKAPFLRSRAGLWPAGPACMALARAMSAWLRRLRLVGSFAGGIGWVTWWPRSGGGLRHRRACFPGCAAGRARRLPLKNHKHCTGGRSYISQTPVPGFAP